MQIGAFNIGIFNFDSASSKITRIRPTGVQETVVENFGLSSCFTFDNKGALWVTEFAAGTLLKMDGVLTSSSQPTAAIEQVSVWPNPAADFATVSFSMKNSGPAVMRVREETGRVVFEQNLGRLEAGQHEAVWRPRDLGGAKAGLYFVEITAGGSVAAKKLLVK